MADVAWTYDASGSASTRRRGGGRNFAETKVTFTE
jgi:hypothetical protein